MQLLTSPEQNCSAKHAKDIRHTRGKKPESQGMQRWDVKMQGLWKKRVAGMAEEPGIGVKRCSPSLLLTCYHACFIETKPKGAALDSARYVGEVAV